MGDIEKLTAVGYEVRRDFINQENKQRIQELEEQQKFPGPKKLDADEIAFLAEQEDARRLKYLERELEELEELDEYNKAVQSKVFTAEPLPPVTPELAESPPPTSKKDTSKKAPLIKIVSKKRKNKDEDKSNSKSSDKDGKKLKGDEKESGSTSSKKEEPQKKEEDTLASLLAYGSDDD